MKFLGRRSKVTITNRTDWQRQTDRCDRTHYHGAFRPAFYTNRQHTTVSPEKLRLLTISGPSDRTAHQLQKQKPGNSHNTQHIINILDMCISQLHNSGRELLRLMAAELQTDNKFTKFYHNHRTTKQITVYTILTNWWRQIRRSCQLVSP